eukprot:42780-Amphidinium_carterae.1
MRVEIDDVNIGVPKLELLSAECKRGKKGPPKENSSDKVSRPNAGDRDRSPLAQQSVALRADQGQMTRMAERGNLE